MKILGTFANANFPKDPEGRVYHLGIKEGEAAQRVMMVGAAERALVLREMIDGRGTCELASTRGFITYTGTYKGTPTTIMSIGMGLAMMDFAVRELRAVTRGPLAIIRLGTCGTPQTHVSVGSM